MSKMVRLIEESSNPNEVRQGKCQEKAKTTVFDFSCQLETTLLSERRSREGGKVNKMVRSQSDITRTMVDPTSAIERRRRCAATSER